MIPFLDTRWFGSPSLMFRLPGDKVDARPSPVAMGRLAFAAKNR